MKQLRNLSIRQKFVLVVIPLILIIVLLDYFQIMHDYHDYRDGQELNKAIVVGIDINHAVHELQKERSISVGFVSSDGDQFKSTLDKQRFRTDSTILEVYSALEAAALEQIKTDHGEDIEEMRTFFEDLNGIRSQVDNHALTPERTIAYYSEIIDVALNTVNRLINETRDKDMAQQVHAIIYFLKSKEQASIERAIGTQSFTNASMDIKRHNEYATIVAGQAAYLDAFFTIADSRSKRFYNDVMKGPDIEEAERMQSELLQNDNLTTDPSYWYDMMTSKVNSLKKVEDFMSEEVLLRTAQIADQAYYKFIRIAIVDVLVGGLAIWFLSFIASDLIRNVKKLENFTKQVTQGDLSQKVHIDSKDEIGQYAKTFNVMLEEINRSHNALRKERDHIQYLYDNVIRQSEVVFENVHQGIFLIDSNLKISNLYSKAMEDIFENKKISGENFSNFMRPHLIPRDLEALEMFIRHLYNPDMDEEVVSQLNPIESVRIYNEEGGVIDTKYIKTSFTRVAREGEIQNIMVTITDQTESILLQQHLEEAENKKKKETEQILSILKIDPSVLLGFLHNTKKELKGISERYEKDKIKNYDELLKFTFETIHNLKGNALLIGLKLMSEKFHDMEELINKTKEKELESTDFLPILYDIDEADKMLTDMMEMLNRVADVYKKTQRPGNDAANAILVDSLEKGLNNMSKEVGKVVQLSFTNEDDITIPETGLKPVQDVMIQLMRNSLVHGIESPNDRMNAGKSITGNIHIALKQIDPDHIEVTYDDDGAGLDLDKIKARALERNLATEEELNVMDTVGISKLIFAEGFSTADEVTEHAGRGQGMNLVESIIKEHQGKFSIDFEQGKKFEMIITFPTNSLKSE